MKDDVALNDYLKRSLINLSLKILITGICGFVGSTLAREFRHHHPDYEIFGIDNFSRAGSWVNLENLRKLGIRVYHGDIRSESDVSALPKAHWVIDAAANPSVLAGIDGKTSSYQLVQYNLYGTVNMLEYCRKHAAGFILLSTSRVYSILGLAQLAMEVNDNAFSPVSSQAFPDGISMAGVDELYSTSPPVSLYGSTKICSEHLALEYGETFQFPVWINRCGVLAGPGQFGHPGQGIFAYWVHSFYEKRPLKYIGFNGAGHQVRDCLHPRDLITLLQKQFKEPQKSTKDRIVNIAGGTSSARSLRQLTEWCKERLGSNHVESTLSSRAFDIPWMVLDATKAKTLWQWQPITPVDTILEEIAQFAENNPGWCSLSEASL